jgi:uncharacterized protein YdeI (YjbR/CyaY-like superfamily)
MRLSRTLLVTNQAEWRAWLKMNHATSKEVWLIHHRKSSGKPSLPYEQAVREALCFGWIDSLVQKIDDGRYARKFTPRRMESRWSALNRMRVVQLVKEGRMTKAGLAKLTFSLRDGGKQGEPERFRRMVLRPPRDMMEALKADGKAWVHFSAMAPSYRRLYVRWVTEAERKETKARRLKTAVRLLAKNRKLGLV